MLTRNGICYDLKESPYYINLRDYTMYFSSKFNRDRFLRDEKKERDRLNESMSKRFGFDVNMDNIAFIRLYTKIEKRGFYIKTKNGSEVTCQESLKFAGLRVKKKN